MILAVLLLLLVCVGAGINTAKIANSVDGLKEDVRACREAILTEGDTAEIGGELTKDWDRVEDWLHSVIRHDEIDEITMLIERCKSLLDTGNAEEFITESTVLLKLLDHLGQMDQIKPENIL